MTGFGLFCVNIGYNVLFCPSIWLWRAVYTSSAALRMTNMMKKTCCHFSYECWSIFEEELHFLTLVWRFKCIRLVLNAVCGSRVSGCLFFAQLILYHIYYNTSHFWILRHIACTRKQIFLVYSFLFEWRYWDFICCKLWVEFIGAEELDGPDALNMYAGRKRRKPVQRT